MAAEGIQPGVEPLQRRPAPKPDPDAKAKADQKGKKDDPAKKDDPVKKDPASEPKNDGTNN